MNIAQLRAFVMVVELGSFSEAARVMEVSQPAVTMQVQGLESDLGATLLERRYRRVELTDAGRALLPHASAVLAELERARGELDEMAGAITGRVHVAASTTPGQYVLPRLLGGFVADNPEARVSVEVMDTAEVVQAVATGAAHVGMTGAEVSGARVVFEAVGTDELLLVCPPADSLASRDVVALAEIVESAFIMRESGSGTRMVAETALRAGGVDPNELRVVMELGTNEAIVNAVEGGMGLGVVSRRVAEKALALGTIAEVRAEGFPVTRPLFLVTSRVEGSRAVSALVEYVRARMDGGRAAM